MLGLRLRSVGENPDAADAAGVSVSLYRVGAIVAGSALIGLAGGYLSVVDVKLWVPDISGGRGWIAVALVIFARWQPWRALFGALLFGCIEALIPRIAAAGIQVPQYFLLMTPYLATIAVMVWAGLLEVRPLERARERSGSPTCAKSAAERKTCEPDRVCVQYASFGYRIRYNGYRRWACASRLIPAAPSRTSWRSTRKPAKSPRPKRRPRPKIRASAWWKACRRSSPPPAPATPTSICSCTARRSRRMRCWSTSSTAWDCWSPRASVI